MHFKWSVRASLENQQVFMSQGRNRFAEFDRGPKQEPLSLLAIVVERGLGIGKARQPGFDGIGVRRGGDLRPVARSPIGAETAIDRNLFLRISVLLAKLR